MQHKRDVSISDIMNTDIHAVETLTDQEDVAFSFANMRWWKRRVVSETGRLVGTITIDDIVEVIEEERAEDAARAAGVYGQELNDSLKEAVQKRFPWLFINLLTAIAASAIIDVYQDTIEQLVLLAVLMPIIASMRKCRHSGGHSSCSSHRHPPLRPRQQQQNGV